MARLVWMATAAVLVASCGGDEVVEATEAPGCTLPDCGAVQPLGDMGFPLRAVGTVGVLAWHPDAEGVGALWHHGFDGKARLVAEKATAHATVDPQGAGVLYLAPTDLVASAPADYIGELRRWDVRSGNDRLLFSDARSDEYGACGDWVWSWHGVGDFVNCGWMSAMQLSTGRIFDLGDSCDFGANEKLAAFASDCTSVATATGLESRGVGIHLLGKDASSVVGSGTGRFLAAPQFDRVVAPVNSFGGLVLADLRSGEERELTAGWSSGLAYRFSPSGRSLVYRVDGDASHLMLLRDAGEPIVLSVGFLRLEALGFSPDERHVAWIELAKDGARRLQLFDGVDVQTVEENAFSGHEGPLPPVEPGAVHFAADGRSLLVPRHAGGGLELVRWEIAAGEGSLLGTLAQPWGEVRTDADGEFAAWIDAGGALRLADLVSGETWQVARAAVEALFAGDKLVWSDGTHGFVAPLPAR